VPLPRTSRLNHPSQRQLQAFGATDFVNSLDLPPGCASIQAHIVSMTKWGADFTFDCTGNVEVMRAALECAHRGMHTHVLTTKY